MIVVQSPMSTTLEIYTKLYVQLFTTSICWGHGVLKIWWIGPPHKYIKKYDVNLFVPLSLTVFKSERINQLELSSSWPLAISLMIFLYCNSRPKQKIQTGDGSYIQSLGYIEGSLGSCTFKESPFAHQLTDVLHVLCWDPLEKHLCTQLEKVVL